MAVTALPAINQDICSGWTENQRTLYQSMDYYLAKMQVERRRNWPLWSTFMGSRKWKPNDGPKLRAVRGEPSPIMRQFAMPNIMSSIPKKDIMDVREVIAEANVRRHRFESPVFNFYPSFNDFMEHIDDNGKDIMDKINIFEDLFLRTMVFHIAPKVFVCKTGGTVELIDAPSWSGLGDFTDGTDGKTTEFLLDVAAQVTGGLNLTTVNQMLTIAETDERIPFFRGSDLPSGEDKGLEGKYCLTTSTEAYNQFTFDPYLQQNKNCDLDVVNKSFRGSLFGRITCKLEDLPLRMKPDGTFAEPEERVAGDDPYMVGMTVMKKDYTSIATSGIEWGFFVGAQGGESIDVGPPPSKFTGNSAPHNFPSMFWNAKVQLTKRFLVPCIDSSTGAVTYEENTYGEYLKFISQAAFGYLPKQKRFIIPVAYKRQRLPGV